MSSQKISESCRKARERYCKAGLCPRCGQRPPESKRYKQCKRCRDHVRAWKAANKELILSNHRDYTRRVRLAVLAAYGTCCACCGESEETFLAIDHIGGGGCKHIKSLKVTFYRWLQINGYPPGFQTLCHNCNWGKHVCGECPHKRSRLDGDEPDEVQKPPKAIHVGKTR